MFLLFSPSFLLEGFSTVCKFTYGIQNSKSESRHTRHDLTSLKHSRKRVTAVNFYFYSWFLFSTSQLYEFCMAVANCNLQINTACMQETGIQAGVYLPVSSDARPEISAKNASRWFISIFRLTAVWILYTAGKLVCKCWNPLFLFLFPLFDCIVFANFPIFFC